MGAVRAHISPARQPSRGDLPLDGQIPVVLERSHQVAMRAVHSGHRQGQWERDLPRRGLWNGERVGDTQIRIAEGSLRIGDDDGGVTRDVAVAMLVMVLSMAPPMRLS